MKRAKGLPLLGGALLFAAAGASLFLVRASEPVDIQTAKANAKDFVWKEQASVGLCPWRDPTTDRRAFFPTATEVREETLILSSKRLELIRRLGRTPTGEENTIKIYRLLANGQVLGEVVARRARGESGVIELVLAVRTDGTVLGAKIQRLREPEAVAQGLQSKRWLGAFIGKTAAAQWRLGADIPGVVPEARSSAEAVLDAAHTILVLLQVGDTKTVAQERPQT